VYLKNLTSHKKKPVKRRAKKLASRAILSRIRALSIYPGREKSRLTPGSAGKMMTADEGILPPGVAGGVRLTGVFR
jgi:hypothetical protein